eukprot:365663-Chlamydomonas_euryale.AAC.4
MEEGRERQDTLGAAVDVAQLCKQPETAQQPTSLPAHPDPIPEHTALTPHPTLETLPLPLPRTCSSGPSHAIATRQCVAAAADIATHVTR